MGSEDFDNLYNIWVKFLNTKNTDEGQNWLDAFLARYLTLFYYNEIPPDHDLSSRMFLADLQQRFRVWKCICGPHIELGVFYGIQYKSSGNVLVHQLLTDVNQICDDVQENSLSPESENEISAAYFRKYLLEGRGWKILWTLDKIGFQNLLHLKDLVNLLISQMPVVLSLPVEPSVIPECLNRKPKHLDLNSCFYSTNRVQSASQNVVDLRKPEMYLPLKRMFRGKKKVRRKREKHAKSSSSSSEELEVIFESCRLSASQAKLLMKDEQGTNNGGSSADTSESACDYAVSNTSISSNDENFHTYSIDVIDYIGFVLDVFQESLILDTKGKDIQNCVSPSVLEFALRYLKEIHSDIYSFAGWDIKDVEDLKNKLLVLLFLSSTVSRVSFGYNEAPNANEIISTLFLISEALTNIRHGSSLQNENIAFVSHMLKGALMLVHNFIETCNGDYAGVICIIRTFTDSGGSLCCKIFSFLDRQNTTEYENELKIIISLVRNIVTRLKIVRTTATYTSDYACDIQDFIHHHDDIFGPPVSHSIINKDPMCCVASMSCLLLKLFGKSHSPKTSNEILKNLKMCGICCCVNPSFILETLFNGYSSRHSETQKLVLVALGKHLFPQLGLVSMCQRQCSYCSKYITSNVPLDRTADYAYLEDKTQMLCTNFESSDSYWSIFNIYNELLNMTDAEAVENVAKHLIELCSVCVSELKTQIFVRVILPQFLLLKDISQQSLTNLLNIKIRCFLSLFPHILSNTELYSLFIRGKGVSIILPFLLNAEFRELTLIVIKILIFLENENRENNLNKNSVLSSFPASRTFCAFLFDHCEIFFQKLKLVFKLSLMHPGLLIAENTSGSSTLEFPVSTESFTEIEELPESITLASDVWNCFKELVLNTKLNCLSSFGDGVLTSGYNLLILLLKNLSIILRIKTIVENQKVEVILQLIQSFISILVNMKREVQHKQSVLEVVKDNLRIHAPKCGEHQKLLFNVILKCCFWSVPFDTPVRRLYTHKYLEREVLDSVSSTDKNETEVCINDDNYAGDSEGSDDSVTDVTVKEEFLCENFIEHGEFIKMLCEVVADLKTDNFPEWISTALHLIQILIKLCQDCGFNKSVLCKHEIPPLLLDIFSNSLNFNHENIREFQLAIMDLFVLLTESSMKVIYIRKIIEFFKAANAPINILLKSLNNMIDRAVHHATWYVTFPCIQKSNTSYLRVRKRLRATYSAHQQYVGVKNVPSAWTSAALFFPLTEDTKWNAVNKGFCFTLWLKVNHSSHMCRSTSHSRENSSGLKEHANVASNLSHVNQLLHIVSIGSEKLLVELWCGKYNGNLVIRVSSYIDGLVTCLSEGTCTLLFQQNVWHHVAVIYSEDTEKSIFTSKFHIIIDGVKEKTCNLKYKRTGIKSLNKCHLLLGNSVPVVEKVAFAPSYSIASFCLFKDNVLTKDIVYYLSSLGPDVSGITNCAIQKNKTFRPRNQNFQNILSSNLDVVLGNKIPSLDILQTSLICSFTAENPYIYLVYPTAPRGFFPLRFGIGGRLSSFEDWPYQKQPMEFGSLSLAIVSPQEYHGFQCAVQRAGGIRIFLFLFANILEFHASEESLSSALNIILKLLNKNSTFVEDFIRITGYELLTQMITNAKCCISNNLLQVLIQNCMTYTFPDKETFLKSRLPEVASMAIVTNPSIFNLMLKSLAFARHIPHTVITALFSLLDLLLNPKHSNLNINVEQLYSVQTLNELMWLMKRNYILFDDNYLPPAVAKMIPIIIEKLLNYKFDVKMLQSITRILLLLHNASATYVCHSPSAFFFLTPKDKSESGSKESSYSKVPTKVSFAGEVVDSSMNPQGSNLHRSSSFPNISATTEKKLSKSKSIEFFPLELTPARMHVPWGIRDIFNIREPDSMNLNYSIGPNVTDSSFGANACRSHRCVELFNGLLKLLYNFITSSNVSDAQALLDVIQPEIFIVLAYTENPESCAYVIKVIDAYLKATSDDKRYEFLSMKGFHLIANQLYQSPCNPEVVDACFSIIFDCPLSSVNTSELSESKKASSFQILSWVPVLALLPNTYVDEALCDRILVVLSQFLHLGTVVIMELLANGLCVSIIHLIINFCQYTHLELDEELSAKHPVIEKIHLLLKYIAHDLCRSRGPKGFNSFLEALQLLCAWERKCEEEYGSESACISSLRNCQCIMYKSIVEFSEIYNLPAQKEYQNVNDEASLWELVVELQGTFGTFSSVSVTESDISSQKVQGAVEAEELDKPSKPESEKSLHEIPMNDIIDRLCVLVESAADFFIFKDRSVHISKTEKEFFKTFFEFIVEGVTITMDKKLMKAKNSGILYALRDLFKIQLGRLLVSSFAPPQDMYVKTCVAEILSSHQSVYKILQLVVFSTLKIRSFLIFLYDLQSGPRTTLQRQCLMLFTIVRQLVENTMHISVLYNKQSMEDQKKEWSRLWKEDRCKWIVNCRKTSEKMFHKMDFLAQDVSTMALYVTQKVFEIQNSERKILIEELRAKYYDEATERMRWLELCEQMTHERAIWYMKEYYPFFWEVDPTEGPSRVRRRLRRCHVHIDPKFFQSDYADDLVNMKTGTPFVRLLTSQKDWADSAVVLHRLFSNEQIKYSCPCKIVTTYEQIEIEILIGAYCIHIIGEAVSFLNTKRPISESWAFESIKEIVPRRHELLNNSFEIFLTNGITYMITFNSEKDFSIIWKQLQDLGLPCETNKDLSVLTQLWRDGTITNFEYLTHLNKLSGRTFNDLMQYPVCPYVLADYESFFLDLENPDSFRNLAKPIAVQLEEKEAGYREHYRMLSVQSDFDSILPYLGPYHYGSHYSNSGTVLHFLIRLLPFTYSFISYQDKNFDCADRTFHNIASSWNLVIEKSTSDVKEIIPEFYFLPEFLCNKNGFDFGVTQMGFRVNDVILPPWSKQNARLFILVHRQALESEFVTNRIHGWIDLIWGYKQTGEAAVEAINVFHPSTYFGMDRNKFNDKLNKDAISTMVRTLGNTPQQLFFSPHPMVSLTLASLDLFEDEDQMEVIDTVRGLRWGNYVGSPASGTPSLVWCRKQSVTLGSFLPLLTNYVFALGENVCLLLNHKKDMGSTISRATYIMSAALVSWGHRDGIVRIKLCRDQPTLPLLRGNKTDPICLCASVPDCKHLFVAHASGIINAYTLELSASELTASEKQPSVQLNGHSDTVTSIYICRAFSVFASASLDKTVILWDLNRLCYVRTLSKYEGPATLVCISDTLGDIASVCNIENSAGSVLRVHTINGDIVGAVQIFEIITAICYSTAPEGLSVNVIATGLNNGVIRLWSSWDLKMVREIVCDRFTLPIRCLTFSADNLHLYASNDDGTVTVWEKPSRGLTSVPRLLVFT